MKTHLFSIRFLVSLKAKVEGFFELRLFDELKKSGFVNTLYGRG